ncbi:carcinoembryonic antigen-related cell adhesion molecule 1-like isoform X2 [Hemicordylus capensis]|uniref:carcinoembryonic antigen-related cell adhesion molecule 1-like isoform X2 n=1 Tax=Hemicordylus capensis TaxID=884348 RepID=UPI002302BD4F|nr:carcinoembryonic antigen-related cell adhesion molecule 1-like isoform X2 [Hemicordylus capensis]
MGRQAEGLSHTWGHLGWRSSWPAALLAVSLLLPPAAGLSVTPVPPNPAEGGSVTLTPQGLSDSFISCSWFRAGTTDLKKRIFIYYPPPSPHGQINGPAYTERETIVATCSLQISDLMLNYSGIYTVSEDSATSAQASVNLTVSESVSNITITGPTEAIEHTITTLNCTSKGTGVSYYWLKENQSPEVEGRIFLSNNNQTLTFNTTFRNDTGNYTCYGYNSFSNASDTYQLVVLYGPGPPTISPPTQDYVEGSNLSLSCKAESNPPAQYLWFVDGNPKGNGSELLTLKLSLNDAGNYICTAVNIRTKHNNSESLEIRVLQKVSNVTINGPSETIENTSVNLTCTSRGSMVTYYWFKGNQSLKSEGHVSLSPPANQSLIMNPVNRSDAGLYTCQGVNSISNDSSPSFPLEVFYGPDDPIISPTDQNYAEGSNLSLSCKAISNVHVQYTWLLNGTEEIFNETVGVGDASQLLIRNLSFNYSGTYTCHAFSNKTNVTSYSDQQPITVWENLNRTKTVLEPTEFMVPENWYVTLKCNTSKSDGVSVSWFKNGEALLTGTGLSDRNRTLNITGVSKNNTGFYTCEARNPVSKSLSNLSNITVAYGPDHIKFNQEGSIQQQIGSTLTLECIVDSVPAAQFQWWLNNTKLNKMGRIYTTQLTWEDGGNYTCQATNPFTNHSDSASVYVTLTKDSKPIGGGGLSGGAIAGIVIGVLAGVALIAGLVYYLCAKTSLGVKRTYSIQH